MFPNQKRQPPKKSKSKPAPMPSIPRGTIAQAMQAPGQMPPPKFLPKNRRPPPPAC